MLSLFVLFFAFGFSTGLVRLYIAGLPLRSCWTIGPPSEGSAQCPFFVSAGSSGTRTHVLYLMRRTRYHYAMLTPLLTSRCYEYQNYLSYSLFHRCGYRQNRPRGHEAVVIPPFGAVISQGRKPETYHCAARWNNDGRVPPRFVLFLLYIKHDQMIARIVKTTKTVFIYITIVGAIR